MIAGGERIREACAEYEAALLRGFLTNALPGHASPMAGSDSETDERTVLDSFADGARSLFVEAFSQALERGGGLGLGRLLAQSLS